MQQFPEHLLWMVSWRAQLIIQTFFSLFFDTDRRRPRTSTTLHNTLKLLKLAEHFSVQPSAYIIAYAQISFKIVQVLLNQSE